MVVGDPEGMRKLAARFSKDADQLRHAASRVTKAWSKADGTGEWFDDVGFVLGARTAAFRAAAGRLDHLAGTVTRAAAEVEHQIKLEEQARRAAAERAAAQAAAEAAQQARG